MIRQTSIDVFHQIKAEGLLSKRKLEAYEIIVFHGPITQMETARRANARGALDHSITPRFAELEREGVIKEIGKRKCSISGRETHIWETTGKKPLKLEKPLREKCKHCHGRGYIETVQAKFDI
jgi:hypothetical protein